jgi:hypothetical protein
VRIGLQPVGEPPEQRWRLEVVVADAEIVEGHVGDGPSGVDHVCTGADGVDRKPRPATLSDEARWIGVRRPGVIVLRVEGSRGDLLEDYRPNSSVGTGDDEAWRANFARTPDEHNHGTLRSRECVDVHPAGNGAPRDYAASLRVDEHHVERLVAGFDRYHSPRREPGEVRDDLRRRRKPPDCAKRCRVHDTKPVLETEPDDPLVLDYEPRPIWREAPDGPVFAEPHPASWKRKQRSRAHVH